MRWSQKFLTTSLAFRHSSLKGSQQFYSSDWSYWWDDHNNFTLVPLALDTVPREYHKTCTNYKTYTLVPYYINRVPSKDQNINTRSYWDSPIRYSQQFHICSLYFRYSSLRVSQNILLSNQSNSYSPLRWSQQLHISTLGYWWNDHKFTLVPEAIDTVPWKDHNIYTLVL